MKKLWAPWRKTYIGTKKSKGCIFCAAGKFKSPNLKQLVLKHSTHCFSMLNKYPYNNGHVMIAPLRHVKKLGLLKDYELLDIFRLISHSKVKMNKALGPAGYNIGINEGRASGAGYPGHIHIHIVPRWEGDTNFMPVMSDTKVISYSLKDMWKALKG